MKLYLKRLIPFIFFLLIFYSNGRAQTFQDLDTLVLEENNEAFISEPSFGNLVDENLFLTDKGQHQVRWYNRNGDLKLNIGRYGKGPGDFENPTSATLLSDGLILVTEFSGRITIFNQDGSHLEIINTGIVRLNDSKLLPNGKVLLTGGMHSPEDHYLLYLFNPESMKVEKKFFCFLLILESMGCNL